MCKNTDLETVYLQRKKYIFYYCLLQKISDIKIIYILYTFSQSLKRSNNRTYITKWLIHCTLGSRTTTTLFLINYNPRKEHQNLTTNCYMVI